MSDFEHRASRKKFPTAIFVLVVFVAALLSGFKGA